MKAFLRAFAALVLVGSIAGALLLYSITRRGLGTRTEPTRVEVAVARAVRGLATPRALRAQTNPVPATTEVVEDGLGHFADHCTPCHANDGSGETEIGRGLYPRAPDLRAAGTQSLSDGELYSIIENGIRLTGMPAWGTGTPAGERASWALVHFIRRLPTLTDHDLARMETLNRKSPAQFREEEETRRFLSGEGSTVPPAPAHGDSHR